jgi:DNA-damage-inducible protein J
MGKTINVTIRLDKDIKERAEILFNDLGMNLSTAYNIFTRQALRQGKIPFEICDPFYSDDLSKSELIRRIKNIEEGKGIFLTDDEFEKQSEV